MATYFYKAKNTKGQERSGNLEAGNKAELAARLRREGFAPIFIRQAAGKDKKHGEEDLFSSILKFDINSIAPFGGVSTAEKMIFSRHLAIMLSAGVPITRALEVLSDQTKNSKFKTAINSVSEDIRSGKRIADALSKYPGIFNDLYVSMVRSGDSVGNLSEVLELLADQLRKDHELLSRVRGALMYPAVILIAMTGVGALMMTTIVPKLSEIFEDLDAELPKTTQVIIITSNLLSQYWLPLLLASPFIVYAMKKFLSGELGKGFLSWTFLHTPVIRGMTLKINSARFSRTLSSLIKGGVPILKALLITKGTLGNIYYKKSMDGMQDDVRKGKTLYKAISAFPGIYPGLIIQMVRVGEESGSLAETLNRIADFYEEEVSNSTKNLSSIIEPVLMIIIGAMVGFFAISMLQPMYGVMGNL